MHDSESLVGPGPLGNRSLTAPRAKTLAIELAGNAWVIGRVLMAGQKDLSVLGRLARSHRIVAIRSPSSAKVSEDSEDCIRRMMQFSLIIRGNLRLMLPDRRTETTSDIRSTPPSRSTGTAGRFRRCRGDEEVVSAGRDRRNASIVLDEKDPVIGRFRGPPVTVGTGWAARGFRCSAAGYVIEQSTGGLTDQE